ncbi:hypothetical protein JAAARDRAFT_188486 [Jaapia argillacea MUCL 33604]|uniref:DUF6532 domain-containing protein n=1 Tax=Jaapia argillacea MUCL 33604 TaxID=933084 RepID=A0A067Q713_9AGAM|nr:hypothetical protein JAAARDRAFT_188486 [Jaapia argillacea MUCL 33604]
MPAALHSRDTNLHSGDYLDEFNSVDDEQPTPHPSQTHDRSGDHHSHPQPHLPLSHEGDSTPTMYSRRPAGSTIPARRPHPPTTSPSTTRVAKKNKHAREGSRGRVRAHDYQQLKRQVFDCAKGHYRCQISTEYPYPGSTEATKWAADCWRRACRDKGIVIEFDDELETLTVARPLVESAYDLCAAVDTQGIACNRDKVLNLKSHFSYAYRDPANEMGFCEHPLIQRIINTMWFRDREDEGVVYERYFHHQLHVVTLALVLTVIECVLDEWLEGNYKLVEFSATAYQDCLDEIYSALKQFDHDTKPIRIISSICKSLLDTAW